MVFDVLTQNRKLDSSLAAALADDYERFADGLPQTLEDYIAERYRLNVNSEYGGLAIKNPFGKASGQLSLNVQQVSRDASAGLGFVVLKTIIAENAVGAQSMSEWAIPETRMLIERIRGADESVGWNVTWKGRGWYETFDAYLKFFAASLVVGKESKMLIVPSCKYHLPGANESEWRIDEYNYTTAKLLDVWDAHGPRNSAMAIEKDFSPTLAGSDRAAQVDTIKRWLETVTGLMRRAAARRSISVGLKLFNAVFDNDFQLEMLRLVSDERVAIERPDFIIYANRLFNPDREFEGVRGVAYGGPDLTAKNLTVLARMRTLEQRGEIAPCTIPISATGNIESGLTAAEYLLRGASSFQMHTFFQLPNGEYKMRKGVKTERALHELYFNPKRGLLACLLRLKQMFDWPAEWSIKRMAEFCADPANKLWATVGAGADLSGARSRHPFE